MSVPALAVRGLVAGHEGHDALKGADVHVAAGGISALLGANGAGKSSLLGAVAGFCPVRAGSIELAGRPLAGLAAEARIAAGIAAVPQGRELFTSLSAEENLLAGGWLLGGQALRRARLEEVLALLPELARVLRRRAGDLSGGQQQVLALGRALMSRPRVLLLDEPSLGLAPAGCRELLALLGRLAHETGMAVLLAEQNVPFALELADRVFVLRLGRVSFAGTPAQFAARADVAALYLGAPGSGSP